MKIEKKDRIKVDTREPPKVIGKLSQWNIHCEREKLDVGDYETKEAVIERKELSDFESNIIEDKIKDYCNNMLRRTEKVIFWILHGNLTKLEHISYKQFWGQVTKIMMRYGYPVLGPVLTLDACMYAISRIVIDAQKIGRPYKISLPRNRPDKKVLILENLLRIPNNSAEELLEEFGTIPEIFGNIKEEKERVLEIKGIGEARYKRMEELIE